MSAPATQTTPHHDPGLYAADAHATNAHAAAIRAADAPCHRQVLNDLIGMGAGFARLLHDTAQAQAAQPAAAPRAADAPPAPVPASSAPAPAHGAPVATTLASLAAAFDQVARAVRRCVMLAQVLDTPRPPAPDPARLRAAARRQVIRTVEDTIQRPCFITGRDRDQDTAEALRAELRECLDAPDLDWDISTRPVADIIQEITRDLGLDRMPGTRPFGRRTPADVARLCAQAAAPSAARQPSAAPQGPAPHCPAPRAPGPAEECAPRPVEPAAAPRAQPAPTRTGPVHAGPVHPGAPLPDDPAEAVATVLRHHAQANARWRPPPSG